MAVAHVTSSQSHASGAFSVSQASFNWTHTTSTDPQGVLILVFQGVALLNAVTSVTYGGTTIPLVSGSEAIDTTTEPGSVKAYYLGSGVPTTDNPTVVVNRTNNTTTMWAVCVTVTAGADTEVTGLVLTQNDGAIAQQSVNDGSTGVNSMRYAGVYYGGATPAPQGANSTLLHSNDAGNYGWTAVRETTAGQGARSVGCVNATSDDRAGTHFAIREVVPPPAITGDVVYVDSTTTGDTALVSSRAIPVPAGAKPTDVVVVDLSRWESVTPTVTTPGAEWVRLGTQQVTGQEKLDIWAKRLTTADTGTYTFSWAGTMWATGHATLYRGVDRDVALSSLRVHQLTASGAAWPTATLNTVPEGSALHWHGVQESTGTKTKPTAWTQAEFNDVDISAYQESVAAGNYSATGGTTWSTNTAVSMVELIPEPLVGGTPVGKDLALVWNTRAAIGDPLQLVWNTRAVLGDPLQLIWNTRTFVGKEVQALWNVRQAVGKSVQALWNTRSAVGKALQVAWDTRQAVGDSLQLVWDTQSGTVVGKSLSLVWNTREAVGDNIQLVWNTRAAVGDPLQLVWNTRVSVGDPLGLVWNTRASVGDEIQLVWNVLALGTAVGKDLSLLWNTKQAVGDPLALVWNTRQTLGDPLQLVWNVRTPVGDPLALVWNTRQAVGKPVQFLWNTKGAIGDDLQLVWNVEIIGATAIGKSLGLVWNTRQALGDSLDLRWNVRARVSDDLTLRWNTRALLADTLDLRWGIRTTVGKSGTYLWAVRSVAGRDLILLWDVEGSPYDPIVDPFVVILNNPAVGTIRRNEAQSVMQTRAIALIRPNNAEAEPL